MERKIGLTNEGAIHPAKWQGIVKLSRLFLEAFYASNHPTNKQCTARSFNSQSDQSSMQPL